MTPERLVTYAVYIVRGTGAYYYLSASYKLKSDRAKASLCKLPYVIKVIPHRNITAS